MEPAEQPHGPSISISNYKVSALFLNLRLLILSEFHFLCYSLEKLSRLVQTAKAVFVALLLQVITGYGVGKVVDSGHPGFKAGDLVWGITGWQEFSLISMPEQLIKIKYTDVPLSYYTGILGMCFLWFDWSRIYRVIVLERLRFKIL